ncbi:hypothetical protein I553_6364 [Mycobacterium xenopi 4042]|uniref:Uncharacterized protein n=1 Tax=Mycobacterium xenopi 4042 TaxID=1299334 RepID=X8BF59_MYCXE|nr:hypothetical protein I553_6364 [Mycobacterium xenopi 4042]
MLVELFVDTGAGPSASRVLMQTAHSLLWAITIRASSRVRSGSLLWW